jgi:WD40 repeat protein
MQTLRKLQPVAMDSSGHTECLPNTRRDVLEHITDWITNPQNEYNVLWLHGLAGSGKSTISTSIANLFRDLNRLGAFVFFSCDVKKRSDPATVVRTLAYQLGSFDPRLGVAIAANIDATPSITQAPIGFQFSKLLVGPLTSLEALFDEGPIVLILDGLDECGNPRARRELISVLAEEIGKLPAFVRTIVTSRAELDIRNAFEHKGNVRVMGLETTSDVTHSDIMSYFRHHMARIRADNNVLQLTPDWPGSRKLRALCDRACGLFIWASTAVFFIEEGHDPEERIDILLQAGVSSDAESALDILYTKALQSAALADSTFISDFQAIIGTIICAKDPLTHSAIDHLLALDKRRPSLHTLLRLGCVLECSTDKPVRVLHPSFADFLSNPRRCKNTAWLIDLSSRNFMLASRCLDRLEETLRRNLYDSTLSLSKIDVDLPEHIAYACVFWIDHICMVNEELTPIGHRVEKFLFHHLLHWLEAMSILKRSWDSAELLTRIAEWARVRSFVMPLAVAPNPNLTVQWQISVPHRVGLSQLINDAIMCTQSYPNFISSHPLLIYESVLPLLPPNSALYQTFHDPSLFPWVAGGFEESYPPPLQKVLSGHDQRVRSVAFSPDGLRIVSCADDGTVRVWDHTSGMESMTPLQGHKDLVFSVCFSPDGTRIISGSKDRTIRIWDVHRREQNQPPLHGHTGSILSVASAPDGRRILSGSEDMTIRLWDVETSTQSLLPLQGHNGWVWSVCFSPDGMQILSGSEDNTIRLWDSVSGTCLTVMKGHNGAVMSVAFAPDGLSVASGSVDQTIRLWMLSSSGEEIVPWTSVHMGPVLSVSFSPDCKRIASASIDTIRLWDVQSGTESSTSLRGGHSDVIHSLAFSPSGSSIVSGSTDRTICVWNMALIGISVVQDSRLCALACSPNGAIVVSGSQDHTLRVWDAASGKEIRGPLRGHTDAISSVSFSPDGTRFASGARDMTVCVWDTTTGTRALGPLKGPKAASLFVAFSADGAEVTACSEDGRMFRWDATTGTCLSTMRHPIDHSCRYRGPLEVTADAWIVEVATGKFLSRLPRTISTVTTVSHKTMIAIGTLSGRLIVMHFPAGAKHLDH